MADETKIEWADSTFNFWIGCTKVSPGCKICYAAARDQRFGGDHWGVGKPRQRTTKANWRKPYLWRKRILADGSRRERVFPSLMDPFDFDTTIPLQDHSDMFDMIAGTSDALDWILLTKRPENIHPLMQYLGIPKDFFAKHRVWLMTSVESQEYLLSRVGKILDIPAALHGISAEPLLGPLDFQLTRELNFLNSTFRSGHHEYGSTIGWVIAGGESGRGARPAQIRWLQDIVEQCTLTDTPVFVKQLGADPSFAKDEWPNQPNGQPLTSAGWNYVTQLYEFPAKHPKGGDMAEFPKELQVRQFPRIANGKA